MPTKLRAWIEMGSENMNTSAGYTPELSKGQQEYMPELKREYATKQHEELKAADLTATDIPVDYIQKIIQIEQLDMASIVPPTIQDLEIRKTMLHRL